MHVHRSRPHLLVLALGSALTSPVAVAQQVVANGTQETPPGGAYQTALGPAFHALNGGSIIPLGPVVLGTTGDGNVGVLAEGFSSRVALDGASITTAGADAAGMQASGGAEIVGNNVQIDTAGTSSHGAVADGTTLMLDNSSIHTRGGGSHGLLSIGLGDLYFRDGQVTVEGANANAVRATGSGGVESFVNVERSTLISRAAGSRQYRCLGRERRGRQPDRHAGRA